MAALVVVALIGSVTPAWSQEQTTKSKSQTTTTAAAKIPVKSPETSAARDSDTTYSIVLAGEKVGLQVESPKKNFPDLLSATTSTLGTDVSDFTQFGLSLPATAEMIKDAPNIEPDIAIIFGGYTDEQEDIEDEKVKAAIQSIAKSLKTRKPEMRIFLMPSATYLGALMGARMRLAAEENGITFVPLGTEVSGEPFFQAMSAVTAELNPHARQEPVEASIEKSAPLETTEPDGKANPTSQPATQSTNAPDEYKAKQASLQRELNRIAGDASDEPSLPNAADILSTSSLVDASSTGTATAEETPLPPGGRVTVKGKDAHEEIQMKSLPAFKAYRPQIPVPRNEIDKKEPALSR